MRTRLRILIFAFVLACIGVICGFAKEQGRSIVQSCGIMLKVSGGQFSPQTCALEITSRGQECRDPDGCPPDYSLVMKDMAAGHISEVRLFQFKNFEARTFRFEPARNLRDFSGQLLDERARARPLLAGEVVLQPVTPGARSEGEKWKISCNLSFDNGIRMEGSGEVFVTKVAAP